MTRYSKKAQEEIEGIMYEYKRGKLKTGKGDKIVKNFKQAVAIGISKARKRGLKVHSQPKNKLK